MHTYLWRYDTVLGYPQQLFLYQKCNDTYSSGSCTPGRAAGIISCIPLTSWIFQWTLVTSTSPNWPHTCTTSSSTNGNWNELCQLMGRNKPLQLEVQSYESVRTQWQSLSVCRMFMNFLRAQVFVFSPLPEMWDSLHFVDTYLSGPTFWDSSTLGPGMYTHGGMSSDWLWLIVHTWYLPSRTEPRSVAKLVHGTYCNAAWEGLRTVITGSQCWVNVVCNCNYM